MDETSFSIIAQVAAKCATQIVAHGLPVSDQATPTWDMWYEHIGKRIREKVVSHFPPASPSMPRTPETVGTTPNGGAILAPSPQCPTHGTMVPGPGQTAGKG